MNLIKWWKELPVENKKLDELASPDSLKRKRALTWKELFFRDKLAVITNFLPITLLLICLLINIITG